MIRDGDGAAARALDDLNITLEAVRQKVKSIGLAGTEPTYSPSLTPRVKKVLELSPREADRLGHEYIGTEHLLLGLAREGEGVGAQVIISLGADTERVRQQVIQVLSGYQGVETVGAWPGSMSSATSLGPAAVSDTQQSARVQCSFCGRQPPDSGQLVSGRRGVVICEYCIRELGDRLDGGAEAT
jgi:ATP-dependent Clp protease ATP-binding subunit ClpC